MNLPWHSKVMLENPWIMQLLLVCLALAGSFITWLRQSYMKRKAKGKNKD